MRYRSKLLAALTLGVTVGCQTGTSGGSSGADSGLFIIVGIVFVVVIAVCVVGASISTDKAQKEGIFISYRRDDEPFLARTIRDQIKIKFPNYQIFFDVDSIEPGEDWAESLDRRLAQSNVMIVVIGHKWSPTGRRTKGSDDRLEDPEDWVRHEIEVALSRQIKIVPVLVDDARLPRVDELPVSMAALARRQHIPVRRSSATSDINSLLTSLERMLSHAKSE